jgi:hypothetical protein
MDVAAAWVLERMPAGTGAALRLARAGDLGEAIDTWDEAGIAAARRDWASILAELGTDRRPLSGAGRPGSGCRRGR